MDPEICDVLRWLRESGVRLAIGSCSKNARTVLQKTGLRAFFDVVADETMITRAKPDPQVFLLAAELLDCPPADCLVVEDARSGIEAAKAGGMKAVLYGQTEVSELADYVITRFSELRAIIAGEAVNPEM